MGCRGKRIVVDLSPKEAVSLALAAAKLGVSLDEAIRIAAVGLCDSVRSVAANPPPPSPPAPVAAASASVPSATQPQQQPPTPFAPPEPKSRVSQIEVD